MKFFRLSCYIFLNFWSDINKKYFTKELKYNNDKLTEVVEERRAKQQLRTEKIKTNKKSVKKTKTKS